MDDVLRVGEQFILRQARLLEQRLFATCFTKAPAIGVVDALRGYQNADGGFGHGLEPDKRCPSSLPIDVEVAFKCLASAGTLDRDMVLRACDFLSRTAAEAGSGGAVPLAFPVIENYPRATHWTDWTYDPGVNPTAGLVGTLYQLGVEHPWMASATAYCWQELEAGAGRDDAHTLSEMLIFLEHVPDQNRARQHRDALGASLEGIRLLYLDPSAPGYGLTPLHLAPTPRARSRALFTDAQIDGHLDVLTRRQQADGGWPITWEPPSEASTIEWRGVWTLDALRTLAAYGRFEPSHQAAAARFVTES